MAFITNYIIFIASLIAYCAYSQTSGCGQIHTDPRTVSKTIEFGGYSRTFIVHRPEGYDPAQGKVPVGVIKGGSFLCNKSYCYRYRPAARQAQDLIFGTSHIGFRIVRD